MADAALKPMTREEFLAWDELQPDRHEFVGGQVYAMTGGSRDHFLIGGNIQAALRAAVKGTPCRVFGASPRVEAANDYIYPDVVVTCEPMARNALFIRQPKLVVEVLSPSTAARDRAEKWFSYQTLVSLEYYLLVSQGEPRVEVYSRRGGSWDYRNYLGLASAIPLPALDTELSLAAMYEGCLQDDPGTEQSG